MFRLLSRLMLIVFATLTALIAFIPRLAPRPVELPPAAAVFGFAACDLPCWAGVTIGATHYTETIPLLAANLPGFSGFADTLIGYTIWANPDPYFLNATIFLPPGGTVSAVTVDGSYLPADWLIDRLGVPDCVLAAYATGLRVEWYRPGWSLSASLHGEPRRMLTPVAALSAVTLQAGRTRADCQTNGATPYAGVAPWWVYAERVVSP